MILQLLKLLKFISRKLSFVETYLIDILSYLQVLYLLSFVCRNLLIEILSYLQLRSSAHQTSLHGSHGPLQRNKQFQFDNWMRILIWDDPDLLFVTNITNYIRGEKIVMWRNFSFQCMTIVGKFWEYLKDFGKCWEVLPQFMRFYVENN